MARRSRIQVGLDQFDPVTGELFDPAPLHIARSRSYLKLVAQMEDRRRFAFNMFPSPVSVRSSDRAVVVAPRVVHGKATFGGLKFRVPERVALCAKRKIRRQVMFAFKRAGKGGAKRSYRRNAWSDIGC